MEHFFNAPISISKNYAFKFIIFKLFFREEIM